MERIFTLLWLMLQGIGLQGQQIQRCAAMERLQLKFDGDVLRKYRFEQQRTEFNKLISAGNIIQHGQQARLEGEVYTIPVVVHIVLQDPTTVTDAAVMQQLAVLNSAFAGTAADASSIPSYFEPLAGKSIIQFCLAQQDPDGLPFSGIDRVVTTRSSFSVNNEGVKHASLGGVDSWDNTSYMNIWITQISGGILGYSSFPEDESPDEQGVVIDYRSMPGGTFTQYDDGKTLVHEVGHFFNLYHIWGDDEGACSGTDYVDDTPNQSNSSSTCSTGKVFDRCTSSGNGIMYQNYMDYTADGCLIMFSANQVERMEAAVNTYFVSLINSTVCNASNLPDVEAALLEIIAPAQRLCEGTFNGIARIQNNGTDTLHSATIIFILSNGTTDTVEWTGALAYHETADISARTMSVGTGQFELAVSLIVTGDDSLDNNSLVKRFQYYLPFDELNESFEHISFAPEGWDVVLEAASGWERTVTASTDGAASAMLQNVADASPVTSLLRLRELYFDNIDSAWLSFSYTGVYDSLQFLLSTDCGQTFTPLWVKRGGTEVLNNARDWARDSVNLSSYIGRGNFMIAVRGKVAGGAAVYLDDIRLRKVIINPNLKASGFLVTPNPVRGVLNVQFYPQPADLVAIQVYALTGQKIRETRTGLQSSLVQVDVSGIAVGTYVVAAVFSNRTLQKRFIKVN